MSDLLNWDNMEEVIASLPKDENGRFLPNPNQYSLSTTRDGMGAFYSEDISDEANIIDMRFGDGRGLAQASASLIAHGLRQEGKEELAEETERAFGLTAKAKADLRDGLKKLFSRIKDMFEEVPTRIVNIAVSKGHIESPEDWLTTAELKNDSVNGMHITSDAGLITITTSPTGEENECWYRFGRDEKGVVYFVVKPKVVDLLAPIAVAREQAAKQLETIDLEQAELANDPLLRAQRGLATLDTTEAEEELEAQARANEKRKALRESGLADIQDSPLNLPDMTPAQLKEWSAKNIERAKGIVSQMDAHLEAGGRVNVADKYLMNCTADLNQLIPFKYNWSWSLYLTSCEHHWMPAELELYHAKADYVNNMPEDGKKLMARAYMSHLSRKRLFPESVLMNIYRMLTNPECRQYLLRQGMESVTVSHAWMEINESLDVKNTLIDGQTIALALKNDDEAFRERHRATMNAVKFMHDYNSETFKKEDLAEFVKAFIILYTHTNWISPLISHYQVATALDFNECAPQLANMFGRLNRDGISQFEFAKLFVAGVVDENPEINTAEWRQSINKTLSTLIDLELDLVGTLKAGENELYDVAHFANHYKDEMMSLLSPSHTRYKSTGDYTRGHEFINVIASITPVIDHSAGLGTIEW